jgi:hypothetical protein
MRINPNTRLGPHGFCYPPRGEAHEPGRNDEELDLCLLSEGELV